jgi:hypothetical protein
MFTLLVGVATRYGMDDQGIESRWGRDFPHLSRPTLRPTQPPIQCSSDLSRGVKRPRRGVGHTPQSSPKVKERIELYLYSPSGPSWPVLGKLYLNLNLYLCFEIHKRFRLNIGTYLLHGAESFLRS